MKLCHYVFLLCILATCKPAQVSRRSEVKGAFSAGQTTAENPATDAASSTENAGGTSPSAAPGTPENSEKITALKLAPKVKTLNALRSSISSCLRPELTVISTSMLISSAATPSGRVRFLDATAYQAGADILEVESAFLNDSSKTLRLAPPADDFSLSYLQALENVANVVAHNCDASFSECQCDDQEKASNMLKRCLPTLSSTSDGMKDAVAQLTEQCKSGEAGRLRAIASLLASYAFATSY